MTDRCELGARAPPGCWRRWSCRAPRRTSRSTVQFSPMNAGPSMRTDGSIDEPLPTQMPGRSSNPATSTSTLPSRMSSWACR